MNVSKDLLENLVEALKRYADADIESRLKDLEEIEVKRKQYREKCWELLWKTITGIFVVVFAALLLQWVTTGRHMQGSNRVNEERSR